MSKAIATAKHLLPGLGLVLLISLVCRYLHHLLPGNVGKLMGESILGMLVGMIIGNMVRLPERLSQGFQFSFTEILKLSIVLLGARFSLHKIGEIGGGVLFLIVGLIITALVLAHFLARAFHISPRLGALIGIGTAICGNTAITITAPVLHARDEELSFAIATNTLFGTLAVFLYPIIGNALGLDATYFGTWAGVAVNDTSQVVATGFSYSMEAGEIALAVKLTRNALLGFVLVVVSLIYVKGQHQGDLTMRQKVAKSMPPFIVGFLLMAILNSVGAFAWVDALVGRTVVSDFTTVAKFLILMALVGVGLNTRVDRMRHLGLSPMLIGFAIATVLSIISFFVVSQIV